MTDWVTIESVIGDLYDVADDYEADVLERLRVRAGHLWKCPECNYVNPRDVTECESCDSPRPSDKED